MWLLEIFYLKSAYHAYSGTRHKSSKIPEMISKNHTMPMPMKSFKKSRNLQKKERFLDKYFETENVETIWKEYLSISKDRFPLIIPNSRLCLSREQICITVKQNITVLTISRIAIGKKNQMIFEALPKIKNMLKQ